MTPDRLDKILNDLTEGRIPNHAQLLDAIITLAKREGDLINHYQGVVSDLMLSLTEAQQTFMRLRGLIK